MRTNFLVALTAVATLLTRDVNACMSDDKCRTDECCYMNICTPKSKGACSTARMDIFRTLNAANMTNKQEV